MQKGLDTHAILISMSTLPVPAPSMSMTMAAGERKKLVLELWAQGHSNAEIATQLGMSRGNVVRTLRKIKPEERIRIADEGLKNLAMRAVGCIESAISSGDVDAAFRLLEGIGILGDQRQAGLSRLGGDTNLTVAIQNLLPATAPVAAPPKQLPSIDVEVVSSANQPE